MPRLQFCGGPNTSYPCVAGSQPTVYKVQQDIFAHQHANVLNNLVQREMAWYLGRSGHASIQKQYLPSHGYFTNGLMSAKSSETSGGMASVTNQLPPLKMNRRHRRHKACVCQLGTTESSAGESVSGNKSEWMGRTPDSASCTDFGGWDMACS